MSDKKSTETVIEEIAEPAKKSSFAHRLWSGEISYEFVGNWRRWYIISAVLLVISIGAILFQGLHLGIEFRGGSNFKVSVEAITADTADEFRVAVLNSGVRNLDSVSVVTIGSNRVSIETRDLDVDEQIMVREAIAKQAGTTSDLVDYQQIGSSWGKQVTQQAGIALVVFLVLVCLLMSVYFRDWKMALSGLIGLIHDMTITIGMYALVGFTVTPATLTGLLTILGYSLYDTVVVFDKIRENTANLDDCKATYPELANKSVNQILVRSINTTTIGVLPVAAILFAGAFILGSGPLEDIGLALFVGMIVAAYSSIFIATPVLVQLRMMEPGMKQQAMRVAKRREKLTKAGAPEVAVASPAFTMSVETSEPGAFIRQQPIRTTRSKRGK
ncbi:MAG: protein translocase subunit SecF [Propionibacteriaceae bacterium]|nr:protein translocase subunit SecF [Propionibacteriaceae bacterium]